MDHFELSKLPWFIGWLIAVGALYLTALRIPLQSRLPRFVARAYDVGVIIAFVAVLILANAALAPHDIHFDLTREKIHTPAKHALDVVDRLSTPVKLTYLYKDDDQSGRRARDIVELMGRRNTLLQVQTVDPDREPRLARSLGVKAHNTAVLDADGRRILVNTVDETEIAIGIQRVLRERVITVCFMQGHNEYPIDNYEFHTHVEGLAGHEHDQGASAVIQTSAHGIGRLRRALESIGYDVRKVIAASEGAIPSACTVLVNARPRTTYLPAESRAIDNYLRAGGALLAMYDLGFVLEPGLARLMSELGVSLPQQVVIDPKSHYATDPEMVAVAGYDKHPVTRRVSYTFYPGMRPLTLHEPIAGVRTVPLITSSAASFSMQVAAVEHRALANSSSTPSAGVDVNSRDDVEDRKTGPDAPRSHILAAAIEGTLPGAQSRPFRAIVIGDGDFASNSFFPFMSNSDLAMSMVRWLVREEKATAIASRVRVPPLILLTKMQMQGVFVFVVLGLPLSIVLCGAWVWWRRR